MGEEEKDTLLNSDATEAKSIEEPSVDESEEPRTEEEKPAVQVEELAVRRGRMVATGLVTAVILSLIAVIVAGIFQVTSRWLAPCPADLPVNDPAPILWKSMTSQQVTAQPLGISEKVSGEVKLKEASVPTAEPKSEDKSDDKK
jgi:hypothetical protein